MSAARLRAEMESRSLLIPYNMPVSPGAPLINARVFGPIAQWELGQGLVMRTLLDGSNNKYTSSVTNRSALSVHWTYGKT
jgi:hypothetical protein